MKRLKVIFGLFGLIIVISLTTAAMATEGQQSAERKNRKACPQGQECVAQEKQMREERRKKVLEEKCHGDSACEAQMKQRFEEKRAKIQAAMNEKCAQGDETCRKEVRQKMIQEFKQNHEKRKQGQDSVRTSREPNAGIR